MPDKPKQLLHLVFGGELTSIDGTEFKDLAAIDIVGVFPNYASAQAAWKAKAQSTVDNAQMRYFIVHLHRLLDPATGATSRYAECSSGSASRRSFNGAAGELWRPGCASCTRTSALRRRSRRSLRPDPRPISLYRRDVARAAFPGALHAARGP